MSLQSLGTSLAQAGAQGLSRKTGTDDKAASRETLPHPRDDDQPQCGLLWAPRYASIAAGEDSPANVRADALPQASNVAGVHYTMTRAEQRHIIKITAMQPISAVLPSVAGKFKPALEAASIRLTLNKKPVRSGTHTQRGQPRRTSLRICQHLAVLSTACNTRPERGKSKAQ